MAYFIAGRIHDGYMTWDDLTGKKVEFIEAVKAAYKKRFPEETIPA